MTLLRQSQPIANILPTYRQNTGKTHKYFIDGTQVRGVTTLINAGFPKPALITWSANTVAEYAVDHFSELSSLTPSKQLKLLKQAPYADRDEAGKRGSEIHAIAERMAHGELIDVIPAGIAGHVAACKRFLTDWNVEPLHTELPVYNREHGYAGTIDAIARSGNETLLIDFKSGRSGVYGDACFQLAAYRHAQFWIDDDGKERPLPQIDRTVIVHVRSDGYSVFDAETGPEVFEEFLSIMHVATAVKNSADYLTEIVRA